MSWIALDEVLRLRIQDIDFQKSRYDIRTVQELLGHNDVRTTMSTPMFWIVGAEVSGTRWTLYEKEGDACYAETI